MPGHHGCDPFGSSDDGVLNPGDSGTGLCPVGLGAGPAGADCMGAEARESLVARILIVDDDPDVVDACTLILEKNGYEVASANNVTDGKAQIQKVNPDLLILDVMMEQPDDGIVMAQDLRRVGFAKPILMLTSISRVTGMSFGSDSDLVPVDAFQEKPIPPKKLLETVAELLHKEK